MGIFLRFTSGGRGEKRQAKDVAREFLRGKGLLP